MEGIGQCFKKLKDRLVEFENPPSEDAYDGCRAHDGEDAECGSKRYAPRKSFGRGALLELIHNGANDPAVEAAIWVEGHRIISPQRKADLGHRVIKI